MENFQELLDRAKKAHTDRKSQTMTRQSVEEKTRQIYNMMIENANIPKRFLDKTFKNYNCYPENQDKFDMVCDYIKNYKENMLQGQWLIMKGGYGLGKTHLAIAMVKKITFYYAKRMIKGQEDLPVNIITANRIKNPTLFITVTDMLNDIKRAYNSQEANEDEIIYKYQNKMFLVIDDLGAEKQSEWQQEKLYTILDYRYREMKPTVITTNCTMNELVDQVGQRVVERMKEAAGEYITGWQGESYRMKESNNS